MTEIPDIDNPLRTAMNAEFVYLLRWEQKMRAVYASHEHREISRLDAEQWLRSRMAIIRSWPDSPEPEKFPFLQPSGSQGAE